VLLVGTKVAPPFSLQGPDGTWRGLSIELWEAAAAELDVAYAYRELPLEELLAGVEEGSLDVAVAALTINPEREARLDFSHPFHISGLGIAVAAGEGQGLLAALRGFLSTAFLQALGALVLVLLLAGALLWLFERKKNAEQFGGSPVSGLGSAFWWSAVTMTTVGYGDKAPTTVGGRLVALVWMFASIIIISGFTAAIASSLTVERLESRIQGPEDLPAVRVGSLDGTTSAAYLENRGIVFRDHDTVEGAMEALARGELDAVVYDAPILQHLARDRFQGDVRVLGSTFQRQDYGIAMPTGSPLRDPLNRALLEKLRSPWWPELVARYLGE